MDIQWNVTYDYPDGWEADTLYRGVHYTAEVRRLGQHDQSEWCLETRRDRHLFGPIGISELVRWGTYSTLAAAIESAEQAIVNQARQEPPT